MILKIPEAELCFELKKWRFRLHVVVYGKTPFVIVLLSFGRGPVLEDFSGEEVYFYFEAFKKYTPWKEPGISFRKRI